MRSPSWLGVLGLSLVGALVACSAPTDDGAKGSASSVTQRSFDKDDLVDDNALRDEKAMTAAEVQRFFDKTPWNSKSVLADYEEDGKSAAEIIISASLKHHINPLALIVRAQMEQGLVSKKTATDATLSIAMGCACPESPACSDKYRGFTNQVECAAGTLDRSIDRAMTSKGTVSGWRRYGTKVTEDGVKVTPKNAATAALYTYTPWVGEAGGGKKGVGGASLHFQVWTRFAETLGYGKTPGNADDDAGEPVTTAPTKHDASADAMTAPDAGPDPIDPPEPQYDAGSPARDAGSPSPDAGGSPSPSEGEGGENDEEILQGNAPPSSNAPPPRGSTNSRSSSSSEGEGEEGDPSEASEGDLDSSSKAESSGCSTTGQRSGNDALVFAGAAIASVLAARRRRR
jgi:hypothetical protein